MIINNNKCNGCKKCENECLYAGIKNGKFTNKCIRCLKCVCNCPLSALRHKNLLPLRLYLKKKPINKYEIYF